MNKNLRYIIKNKPFSNNLKAAFKRLPAITTTDVVPSPASISWAFDNSTSLLCKQKQKINC